ncbi:MAG: DNA-protecting protein DprA [Gemmatimonadaceae bacterium]|nr:DNA-protecting protein DprA [Gemmatimonadaceae bacterium]
MRGLGAGGWHEAAAQGGPAAALLALTNDVQQAAWSRARDVVRTCARLGVQVLEFGQPTYPTSLTALADAPPVLFALGRVDRLSRVSVAIVGTREATSYGVRVTARFASGASRAGVTVVSGLARGVDAHAHRAALDGEGGTVAVLGTGVDMPYPLENLALYETICRHGVVVSEALPGARAHRGAFPRRNRLIAALADVILVTEAGHRSGALITATVGGAINRICAAVPGPIDVPASAGSNQLLRDGAQAVASVEDLLGLLALTTRGRMGGRALSTSTAPDATELGQDESAVVDVLRVGPRLPDELLAASGLSPSALAAALATLTVQGWAEVDASGMVRAAWR